MQLTHRRLHFRNWVRPADCVLWLSSAKSGNVSASGTWLDQSAGGNNGTLLGNAYVTAGTGLILDGTGDWARVPDAAALDFSATGLSSLCLWMKLAGYQDYMALLIKTVSNNPFDTQWSFDLGPTGRNLRYFEQPSSGAYSNFVNGATTLNSGTWYHVARIANGTTHKVYVNGVEDGTAADNANPWNLTGYLGIGFNQDAVQPRYFNGTMDEVMIFSRALSVGAGSELASIIANPYHK